MTDHHTISSTAPASSAVPPLSAPAQQTDHTAERHIPGHQPGTIAAPGTFSDDLAVAVRARRARLRQLWQMTPAQRVAAMRRGELTYEQLAAWSARFPEQIPIVDGEYLWLIAHTPEVCE